MHYGLHLNRPRETFAQKLPNCSSPSYPNQLAKWRALRAPTLVLFSQIVPAKFKAPQQAGFGLPLSLIALKEL